MMSLEGRGRDSAGSCAPKFGNDRYPDNEINGCLSLVRSHFFSKSMVRFPPPATLRSTPRRNLTSVMNRHGSAQASAQTIVRIVSK